ncbi:DUF1841 family protein [Pseudomaricurvus alcaniphilus]|uniref:DUF6714 family protein n=1 Tax=Pseudomaricurvus alcaniphilus TaxID=1166482 RepID=UPI00140998BE|nr:DUF6714 family protein [Pseudomaricurvus alcaniphilus]NHN37332.1 DUF1841 family protein [Pseudomaricurvus alcaniphilus]
MDRVSIEKDITSAFLGVRLGKGIGLWEAQAIDDYETKEVQTANRERDQKQDWRLLDYGDLQRCHSSLSFFDADGMRFHLPAFIIGSIRNEVDDPLFHLIQLDEYSISKLQILSNIQRKSVVMYLKWCLEKDDYKFDHPSIRRALNEYWENQCYLSELESKKMNKYEPIVQDKKTEWLNLDEEERVELVRTYHENVDDELEGEPLTLHAAMHVIVENQIAMGEENVESAATRLIRQGLSRHEAVHAIAAILSEHIYDLLKDSSMEFCTKQYRRKLEKITAKRWRKGQY